VERQEIRIAVVMNGGVSLAIWISGVVMELHRIVSSSRKVADQTVREYQALLQLLLASARIDVISGTSAGGLNGGFLAVGLTRDAPLDAMGAMWADQGAFLELLRQPQSATLRRCSAETVTSCRRSPRRTERSGMPAAPSPPRSRTTRSS
jgi:predicted acylesterase/phospholipase RssA